MVDFITGVVVARYAPLSKVHNEILCELNRYHAPLNGCTREPQTLGCLSQLNSLIMPLTSRGWIVDQLENGILYSIGQNQWAVGKLRPEQLGFYLRRSLAKRNYKKYESLFNK